MLIASDETRRAKSSSHQADNEFAAWWAEISAGSGR
jgi:hypothetical protein